MEDRQTVPVQVLQEEVPVQVLVHDAVPLPVVLIEVGGVPEVLVKLTVCETRELRVEIGAEVEREEEGDEPGDHDRLIPRGEHLLRLHALVEHVDQGRGHCLLDFIDQVL